MATDRQVYDALERLATLVKGAPLESWEATKLATELRTATGTSRERVEAAISRGILTTDHQLRDTLAASRGTDQLLRELAALVEDWRPAVQ